MMAPNIPSSGDLALLPIKAVRAKCGISEATIYRLIHAKTFPKPYKVGTRSLWLSSELDLWILQQVECHRTSRQDAA